MLAQVRAKLSQPSPPWQWDFEGFSRVNEKANQNTEILARILKAQRETEKLVRQLPEEVYERLIFYNKKFKVIFRHTYSLMDSLLSAKPGPIKEQSFQKLE